MSINEESRQVEIAEQLAENARTLAHSTRAVPKPSDSYTLLAVLAQAQESLAQVYSQLAAWHGRVLDGTHYSAADGRINDVTAEHAVELTKRGLERAEQEARWVANELYVAHSNNGVIRWFDEVTTADRAIAAAAEMENHNGEEVN